MTPEEEIEDKKMPLLDHLVELRSRLIYCVAAFFVCVVACFFVAGPLYQFLAGPLRTALGEGHGMIYTHLAEAFFTQLKVALFFGGFISFPWFEIQFWKFVAPGLYKNERAAFLPFLVATPVMFFAGGAFVHFIMMPLAIEFFMSFQTAGGEGTVQIDLLPKVNEYFSLVMQLVFAFGLCFQLPVIMTFLARAGVVSAAQMKRSRRYAIVGVFIFAAIFTPPDPISQLLLAIPLIILYEISIQLAVLMEKKRKAKESAEEAEYAADA